MHCVVAGSAVVFEIKGDGLKAAFVAAQPSNLHLCRYDCYLSRVLFQQVLRNPEKFSYPR